MCDCVRLDSSGCCGLSGTERQARKNGAHRVLGLDRVDVDLCPRVRELGVKVKDVVRADVSPRWALPEDFFVRTREALEGPLQLILICVRVSFSFTSRGLCLTHSGGFEDGLVPNLGLVVEKEQDDGLIQADGQVFVASVESRFERGRAQGVVPFQSVPLVPRLVKSRVGHQICLHLQSAMRQAK